MADAVETFKKFPLGLQLVLGGAAVAIVGSFMDLYKDIDHNLLDTNTGIVILAAVVVGAVFAYLKKFGGLAGTLSLLGAGALAGQGLGSILDGDDYPDLGLGGWLLLIAAVVTVWGVLASDKK